MNFEHILVHELAGEDEEEFIVCGDYTLDLDELVAMDILLELPTRILCREDCKGLCPKCGTNLNESTCQLFSGKRGGLPSERASYAP